MQHSLGVIAAASSAAIGGVTIAATRILVASTDPLTLSVVRFTAAFVMLLALVILVKGRWPPRRDWGGVIVLGIVAHVIFSLMFSAAMLYTTSARAGLAFSTMPLQTMVIAALLGVERLSFRRTLGVLIAMGGVLAALATGVDTAPAGAWRGDLIMLGGVSLMSGYIVAARPYIARSDPLTFTAAGTGAGVACLIVLGAFYGDFASFGTFGQREWLALIFVSVAGGAVMFLLWAFALGRASPTPVAVSVTANPITASIAGALLLAEPIGLNLLVGLVAVVAGIVIAASGRPPMAGTGRPAP